VPWVSRSDAGDLIAIAGYGGLAHAQIGRAVMNLAASAARDLFEAGLNEAASCGPGPMGARSARRQRRTCDARRAAPKAAGCRRPQ
jgi:hypothetical protein